MNSADLIRRLQAHGWEVVRVKGSHHQLRKSGNALVLTVPHPKKDLGKGLAAAILRAAGLK